MIKIIPLIKATLKSFVRNKTSILLLIVAPLVLISVIFLSFNPEGLQKVPVGIIDNSRSLNLVQYEHTFFSYLSMKEYNTLEACMAELHAYREYACIHILEGDRVVFQMHYDNTKEPVIWELVERIKSTIDILQKQQAKESFSSLLDVFDYNYAKVVAYQEETERMTSGINSYISKIDQAGRSLQRSRNDLSMTLDAMSQDLNTLKNLRVGLIQSKSNVVNNARANLDHVESLTHQMPSHPETASLIRASISNMRSNIDNYNSHADIQLSSINTKIRDYETEISRGRNYLQDIHQMERGLLDTRQSLIEYKSGLEAANEDINQIKKDFDSMRTLDAEGLVSSVVLEAIPTYIPRPIGFGQSGDEEKDARQAIKGINMISLQTIYPTVLFLIILFLSLLISSFVCLSEINSSAHKRIRLVRKIFFPEALSTYISSMIIIIVPILFILLAGDLLFQIPVLSNIFFILLTIFMTSSSFVLIGMAIAYIIRKESITLLLTTFILVLFIFLSGVILPLERMSSVTNAIASNFPTYLGIASFNKVVFYSQYLSIEYIVSMVLWLVFLTGGVLLAKKLNEKK